MKKEDEFREIERNRREGNRERERGGDTEGRERDEDGGERERDNMGDRMRAFFIIRHKLLHPPLRILCLFVYITTLYNTAISYKSTAILLL